MPFLSRNWKGVRVCRFSQSFRLRGMVACGTHRGCLQRFHSWISIFDVELWLYRRTMRKHLSECNSTVARQYQVWIGMNSEAEMRSQVDVDSHVAGTAIELGAAHGGSAKLRHFGIHG